MRNPFLKAALLPAVLLLVFASGCNVVESPDASFDHESAVFREQFCVTFTENRTSTPFASEIVCDQFQDQILAWLAANEIELDAICNIFMAGGSICLNPYQGHDWDVTSKVLIERLDIPDGPKTLLRSQTVTIPDTFEPCYYPRFSTRGVKVVNRALEDLIQGGNPILQVTMTMTDVDPEPSGSDPLIFSWDACIDILAVVGGYPADQETNCDENRK